VSSVAGPGEPSWSPRTAGRSQARPSRTTGRSPAELAAASLERIRHAVRRIRCRAGRSRPSTRASPAIPYGGSSGWLGPQLTAFFTSAPILASLSVVNSVRAKEVGHMVPSSRFAAGLKPNVAYLSLNFDAAVK
jgi:hypothetical protein